MSSTWNHPKLGQFERKGSTFSTTLTVAAFQRFSYDTGRSNAPRSTGRIKLSFGPWLMNEQLAEPTREMVDLAEKVFDDPDKLVDAVAGALWEEFNGRGPTTGAWWYGGMDAVCEAFRGRALPPPKKPEEILVSLQLTGIHIFPHISDYLHPIAYLEFHAAFEEEHGFCLVTDGETVLGTGYSGEPSIGKRKDNGSD